eukprot:scaffold4097_cov306-Pinguiococcus_pyrenoidosus.AAC.2
MVGHIGARSPVRIIGLCRTERTPVRLRQDWSSFVHVSADALQTLLRAGRRTLISNLRVCERLCVCLHAWLRAQKDAPLLVIADAILNKGDPSCALSYSHSFLTAEQSARRRHLVLARPPTSPTRWCHTSESTGDELSTANQQGKARADDRSQLHRRGRVPIEALQRSFREDVPANEIHPRVHEPKEASTNSVAQNHKCSSARDVLQGRVRTHGSGRKDHRGRASEHHNGKDDVLRALHAQPGEAHDRPTDRVHDVAQDRAPQQHRGGSRIAGGGVAIDRLEDSECPEREPRLRRAQPGGGLPQQGNERI